MSEIITAGRVALDSSVYRIAEKNPFHKISAASPIGMFDSGVGGLSVLKEVMGQLPREEVIYFGDTARVPYGGRDRAELIKFNREIIDFLVSQGAKAVIIACGTSSAVAYPVMKEHYKTPLISLIEPGAQAAVRITKTGRIGVIATQATVDSNAYQEAMIAIDQKVQVTQVPCPLFVPLIEGGFTEAEETKRVAIGYLKQIIKNGCDTIILGCTHYPHLLKLLREIAGQKMNFVDPAQECVTVAKRLLDSKGLLSQKEPAGQSHYKYFVSGSAARFAEVGSKLMGFPLLGVKQAVPHKHKS